MVPDAKAEEPPRRRGMKRPLRWLGVSLALILVGGLGAHWVQTDFGRIEVSGLRLPAENGQWIVADLFRPRTATAKNPAPLVVVCPGFERSKETMEGYSIELARRGIVVITIDPYSQGASSSSLERRSTTVEGNGVIPVVEYVCDTPNLNYVDKTRIGAAGYSAGGNAVLQSAARLGARQPRPPRAGKGRAASGGKAAAEAPNRASGKLSAVFVGGYILTLTDDVLQGVDANVAIDYAYFDEGAFRAEKGNARLSEAPEALRLVNSALARDKVSTVEIGKIYGEREQRTMRVVYNTRSLHPLMPYAPAHIANMVGFFTASFKLEPSMAASRQIWPARELFTLMALLGSFLSLAPLASLLLRLPIFSTLIHPLPPAPPARTGTHRLVYWVLFAVSALAACFLFIPLARATAVVFSQASARVPTWWFPERINNAILLWAVATGTLGLVFFFFTARLSGKGLGARPWMAGLSASVRELANTLGLATAVWAAFYSLLWASYGLFHTDFRFVFISAAASFPPKILLLVFEYVPFFFIFYLANSIRVNCANHVEGQKEWVGMLISALGNSVGLILLLAIQYGCLAATGTVYWTDEWLYVNLLLGVIPMMVVLPIFNRCFFRLTGRVYLGPMITCLIFITMMLTSNVCYLPLD